MLFQQRQQEIESGKAEAQTEARVNLRALKSITDEFEIIDSIVSDQIKIVQKIMQ